MASIQQLVQAASFYKKKKKRELTPLEQIIQVKEIKALALQIGIDASERNKYDWFFQQITAMDLPEPYERFYDQKANQVTYVDRVHNISMKRHPNLNLFRRLFYQFLQNDQGAATFVNKSKKLLPFIEEKLARDNIGLSSKRREFQKVNLKHDSGQAITSKLERVAPETNKLLQTRNYLLKNLIDKVVNRQEIMGSSKRAKAYATILSKNRIEQYIEVEPRQLEESVEEMQTLFNDAKEFYRTEFGSVLNDIPEPLWKTQAFLRITPAMVSRALYLLGVSRQDQHLYWLGRLYCCLPMPPNWQESQNYEEPEYLYAPFEISFQVHPCILYIVSLINYHKHLYSTLSPTGQQSYLSRRLQFMDVLDRKYEVDLYHILQKEEAMDSLPPERNVISDWVLLEGLSQHTLMKEDAYLMEHVYSFFNQKHFIQESNWLPCVGPFGEVFWSSKETDTLSNLNPFQAELIALLAQKKLSVEDDIFKGQYTAAKAVPGFNNLMRELDEEKKSVIRDYLNGQAQGHSCQRLQNYLSSTDQQLESHQLFDAIFYNPFNLTPSSEQFNAPSEYPPYFKYVKMRRVLALSKMLSFKLRNSKPLLQDIWKFIRAELPFAQMPEEIESFQDIQIQLGKLAEQNNLESFIPPLPEASIPDQEQVKEEEHSSEKEMSSLAPISMPSEPNEQPSQQRKKTEEEVQKQSEKLQEFVPFADADQEKIDQVLRQIEKSSNKRNKFSQNKSNRQQIFHNLRYIQTTQDRLKAKRNFLLQNIQKYPKEINVLVKPTVPTHQIYPFSKHTHSSPRHKHASYQQHPKSLNGPEFLSSINQSESCSIVLPKTNCILPGLLPEMEKLLGNSPIKRMDSELSGIKQAEKEEAGSLQQNEGEEEETEIRHLFQQIQDRNHTSSSIFEPQPFTIRHLDEMKAGELAHMFTHKQEDNQSTRYQSTISIEAPKQYKIIKHKRQLYLCPTTAQYWNIRKLVTHLGSQDDLSKRDIDMIVRQWLSEQGPQYKQILLSRLSKKVTPFWISKYEYFKKQTLAPGEKQVKTINQKKPSLGKLPEKKQSQGRKRCLSTSRLQVSHLKPVRNETLLQAEGFNKRQLEQYKQTVLHDFLR